MKLKDLLKTDTPIDTYNNVYDEDGVCVEVPISLTAAGKRKFGDLMELNVSIVDSKWLGYHAVVDIDTPEYKRLHKLLNEFLWAQAGYVSCEDFVAWFRTIGGEKVEREDYLE